MSRRSLSQSAPKKLALVGPHQQHVSALAAILFVLAFAFIFLIATPHHGVSADLPKIWNSKSMPGANREDALTVVILRDGSMYFAKGHTKPGDVPEQIQEGVGRGAEKKIYIRADARVRYRTVLEVLDAVRSAGVEKMAFLVYQRHAVSSGLSASAASRTRSR
jgi:biopolymer transport protein ExbD